jgi:hypothetical protein
VNAALQELLDQHLWRDEEVLWYGQPTAVGPVALNAARHAFRNGLATAVGSAVVGVIALAKVSLEFGIGLFELSLIAGAVGFVVFVGASAIRAWSRARILAGRTVYAVTNRRVLVVQGDDEHWVGKREIAGVAIRGGDIRVTRQLTGVELRQAADSDLDERLADRIQIGTRELVLAAVPEPQRVMDLLQTPQRPSAS